MDVEKKLGGPYSKSEREMRQNEVYIMYFEQGYSAVRIAETLQVNRNTINEDIKYWYARTAESIPKNGNHLLLKHIQKLENQQARLLEASEKCPDFKNKLNLERLQFEINLKILIHYSHMININNGNIRI